MVSHDGCTRMVRLLDDGGKRLEYELVEERSQHLITIGGSRMNHLHQPPPHTLLGYPIGSSSFTIHHRSSSYSPYL